MMHTYVMVFQGTHTYGGPVHTCETKIAGAPFTNMDWL